MELREIPYDETLEYMKVAFEGDADLKNNRILPLESTDAIAQENFDIVAQNEEKTSFAVINEGEPIGFSVISKDPIPLLISFGINIKHRKGEILKEWLGKLTEIFGETWFVVLNEVNARAIKFFKRNNFNNSHYDSHNKAYLLWQ